MRCSSSSNLTTASPGPTAWATKTQTQSLPGRPPTQKAFVSKTSTSAPNANLCAAFRNPRPCFSLSGRTLSLLPRSRRSRMYPVGWRRRSGAGMGRSVTIKGESTGRGCCFRIWISVIRSRLKVGCWNDLRASSLSRCERDESWQCRQTGVITTFCDCLMYLDMTNERVLPEHTHARGITHLDAYFS
jgi:hypothetical protein